MKTKKSVQTGMGRGWPVGLKQEYLFVSNVKPDVNESENAGINL